jgi:signal transduction histidine kinase
MWTRLSRVVTRTGEADPPEYSLMPTECSADALKSSLRLSIKEWVLSKNALLPVLAVALTAAACATVAVLQLRASKAHVAQVALVRVENQFNQLQQMPWNVQNPRAGTPAQVKAGMKQYEMTIVAALRSFAPGAFASVRTPLRRDFAILDRIWQIGVATKGFRQVGPVVSTAQREIVTQKSVFRTLEQAEHHYHRTAQIAQRQSIAGGMAAVVLLLAAFLFYHRRSARYADAREAALEELRAAQEERRTLLARTVEVAEHERIRLSLELHDGPIQQLTALAFTLDRLGRRIDRRDVDGVDTLLVHARHSLTHEMSTLRRLMVELRPPVLDERGIGAALDDACADVLEGSDILWKVTCDVSALKLAPELETVIYRVVREALVNARRHADAANVEVTVRLVDDAMLGMTISDDGKGFEVKRVVAGEDGSCYGLLGMDERVRGMAGQIEIISGHGGGTQIRVRLPLKERAHALVAA